MMQDVKVLIVDDDTDYIALVKEYLHGNGLSVIEENYAIDALETALVELPDVILLDVMMPGMNGYEICCALKADKRTCNIPVVMLTARAGFNDKLKGYLSGAHKYITKPCELEDIRESICRMIAHNKTSGRLAHDVEMP